MALTLKWWTDLKAHVDYKVDGKSAPETEFEKKLKVYDKRVEELAGIGTLTLATRALTEVEGARAASHKALLKTFPKLATKCDPNSRTLNTVIAEEKKMLEAKKKEFTAISNIGPAQMQGLGPGGANIRQKNFELLQSNLEKLHGEMKATAKLTKEQWDTWSTYFKTLEKDVKLFTTGRADAKSFNDDYVNTVAGFSTVKAQWGKQAATDGIKNIGVLLARMVNFEYVK